MLLLALHFLPINSYAQNLNTHATYSIEKGDKDEPTPLKDVLQKINVLYLNNADELVGGIFVIQTDINLIVTDAEGNEVYVFDRKGKQKKSFSSINGVEKQFNYVSQVWRQGNEICVYDATLATISFFNLKGQFIKDEIVKLTNPTSLIGDGAYYYFDLNRRTPYEMEDTNHNIFVFDNDMHRLPSLLPYDYKMPVNTGVDFTNFNNYGNSIFYHQPQSENIYRLSSGKAILEVKIDFGDEWAWNDEELTQPVSRYQFYELSGEKRKIVSFNSWLSDEYIYLTFYRNQEVFHSLINRKTGSVKNLDFNQVLKSSLVNRWYDNELQFTIESTQVEELRSLPGLVVNEMNKPSNSKFSVAWLEFKKD